MKKFFRFAPSAAVRIAGACAAIASLSSSAPAAELKEARVTQIVREVNLLPGQQAPRPARVSETVGNGTAVRTGLASRSELTFNDQTITRLGANTIFSFTEGTRNMDLKDGVMLLRVPKNVGGAKINSAAVTAAITGTTVMFEAHPAIKVSSGGNRPKHSGHTYGLVSPGEKEKTKLGYYKFICLEGTARLYDPNRIGESVLVKAGQMVIGKPGQPLSNPVDVDIGKILQSSLLITGFGPLGSESLMSAEVNAQAQEKANGQLYNTNLAIYGGGTNVALGDPTNSNVVQQATNAQFPPSSGPTPPGKYGPPTQISGNYQINSGTQISNDPTITTNGVTNYGTIYRNFAQDGLRSLFFFGSTRSFDTLSGFDNQTQTMFNLDNIAVFKFDSLQLAGNPTISIPGGAPTKLALVGANGITSGPPGGTLTFSGLDTLLLATQSGNIVLGSEVSFQNIQNLIFYARGTNAALTIGSPITGTNVLLNSEGTVQLNGSIAATNVTSYSSGDFLAGTGVVTATNLSATSTNGNVTIVTDNFQNPNSGGTPTGAINLAAANTLTFIQGNGTGNGFDWASLTATGQTINFTSTGAGHELNFTSGSTISFTAGTGGFNAPNLDIEGPAFSILSIGDINVSSAVSYDPDLEQNVYEGQIRTTGGSINSKGDLISGLIDADGNITSSNGSIMGSQILAGGNISAAGSLEIQKNSENQFGNITAGGNIIANGGLFTPGDPVVVSAGGSISAPGVITGTLTAGTDITIDNTAGSFGFGIIANQINAGGTLYLVNSPTISPNNGGSGGNDGETLNDFAMTVGSIVSTGPTYAVLSSNGGDANANFSDSNPGNGGKITLTITGGGLSIGDGNELGAIEARGGAFNPGGPFGGGNGGTVDLTVAGDVLIENRAGDNAGITATTGIVSDVTSQYAGNGGTVNVTAAGQISVDGNIKVSSDDATELEATGSGRESASGGSIDLQSNLTTGSGITITANGGLLSYLNPNAPGPGGTITLSTMGADIAVDGTIEADRGMVDISSPGDTALISLSNADILADSIKITVFGANGSLNIGGGTLNANTVLKLYAAGSNGSITFTANVSLNNQSAATIISAHEVTILDGVIVTIGGPYQANVFADIANYTGSGGNDTTTGMFAGAGATTQPFSTTGTETITYLGATGGNWSSPASWNPNVVPNNGGGNTYNAAQSGGLLIQDIAAGVTIEQFQMSGGTLRLDNPLTLNAGLQFSGGAINSGVLNVAGASTQSALMSVSGTTINNSGTYNLTLDGSNVFSGSGSTFNNYGTLVKVTGTGTDNFNIALNNSGTVSSESGTLLLSIGGTSAGTFSASAGAALEFASNWTFTDGTQFEGTGTIKLDNATTTAVAGTLNLGAGSNLSLNGQMQLTNNATLAGPGAVIMTGNAQIGTNGNSYTLTNQTTIEGSGLIGSNVGALYQNLSLNNQGLINANSSGNTLAIAGTGSSIVNLATMEATNGGILTLAASNPINNTSGNITASGAGSIVNIQNTTIQGGTLTTNSGGVMQSAGTAGLDGLTYGAITLSDGSTYTAGSGALTAVAGTLNLGAGSNLSLNGQMQLTNNATLAGPGAVIMTGNAQIGTRGGNGYTVTNQTTIEGSGLIGSNVGALYQNLSLTNQGLIDANSSGNTLAIAGTGSIVNVATMEATNGGVLTLSASNPINNTSGNITASGAGSIVNIQNTTIQGGTLTTNSGGVMQSVGTAGLDGLTYGAITLSDGSTYTAGSGALTAVAGTLNLGAGSNLSLNGQMQLTNNATLAGPGAVIMTGNAQIGTNGNSYTLTNQTTIEGSGLIGSNVGALYQNLSLNNQGLINANSSGNTLAIAGTGSSIVNLATMEATNGGILTLAASNPINNTSGNITASGAGSIVNIQNTTIQGGTLTTNSGGVMQSVGTAGLDGLTYGAITLSDGSTYTAGSGALTAVAGTLNLGAGSNLSLNGQMQLTNNATLAGPGAVIMTGNAQIGTNGNSYTLTNQTTIEGSGLIGSNVGALYQNLSLTNQGLINANSSGNTLAIAGTGSIVNVATMEATNGGILNLSANGGIGFTNSGTIQAASGGVLQFTGSVTSSGLVDVDDNSLSVTGSGSYTQTAGTFRVAGGTVTSSTALNFEGGLVDAWGTITAAITNNAMLRPSLGAGGLVVNGNVSLLSSSNLVFNLGGLTQGSQYSYLNINGTVALGGQLVLSFVNAFQNSVNGSNTFTLMNSTGLSGSFTNIASGSRLTTSDGFGSFLVTYGSGQIILSNFQPAGGSAFGSPQTTTMVTTSAASFVGGVLFDGASSDGSSPAANAGSLTMNVNSLQIGGTSANIKGPVSFNGGNGNGSFAAGNGGIFIVNAVNDLTINSDIEVSTGKVSNGSPEGTGGSVTLNSANGTVSVSSRIQVSHAGPTPGRSSARGGNIALASGRKSGVAINVANTAQLLALLDAAAPGPGGKVTIVAGNPAPGGDNSGDSSSVNVSGTVTASRGTINVDHYGDSGTINLSGAQMSADVIKAQVYGANGTLNVGGDSIISADSVLNLYASGANGTVNFIGNCTLGGNSVKTIWGNTVNVANNVVVTVSGPTATIYTNNANYSSTYGGGNNSTNGAFKTPGGASGANTHLGQTPPGG